MKLAFIFDAFYTGGIERVGLSYIRLLTSQGHEVDAYVLRRDNDPILQELCDLCPTTLIDLRAQDFPEAAWPMALQDRYGGLETLTFGVLYLLRLAKQPLLHSLRRVRGKRYDIAIAFSGHIKDLSFVAGGYIRAEHYVGWLHGAQYQYALLSPGFFRLYKKIKNLVCLSEQCDADCARFNAENHIRKAKIYNPSEMDPSTVDPARVAELRSQYGDFCLMVARLARDKDQETVLRAMKQLKDVFGLRKKLLLVGDGEERGRLEQLVQELGLTDDVQFEGTRSDVQNYYSAAAILVHAAPQEGLPTVFLEAMHFGLPIAAADAIHGTREILGDSVYGLVSPTADPEALAANLRLLYEDAALRNRLSEAGKQRLRDFSPQAVLTQITAYFDSLSQTS